MHFKTEKVSVKRKPAPIYSKSLIFVYVTVNHQSKSALEKDIEFIRQTISRRGKEDQYSCISQR